MPTFPSCRVVNQLDQFERTEGVKGASSIIAELKGVGTIKERRGLLGQDEQG